ncbi:MAG: metallopeptidase [bacterium]|nr:metallopeptidase [bacterium]
MKHFPAPDIKTRIDDLIDNLNWTHIKKENIFCIRSIDAKTKAIARIWGIGKIFTQVIGLPAYYVIEVNRRRFDKLSFDQQTNVLIHELMHIPKTFSGALLSHRGRYHHINNKEVAKWLKKIKRLI